MSEPAILVLTDGSIFQGTSIGSSGHTVGEVVFNTSMTGYQEILTDPSYTQQIVTLTYPHVGNTGVNQEDTESNQICTAGLIIRDLPLIESSFRSEQNLADYLNDNNIVAIAGIDTRRLTRILRDKGAQAGCILTIDSGVMTADILKENTEKALELAKSFGSMAGKDLVQSVTCKEAYSWTQGEWKLGEGYSEQRETLYHVVAYDFGVKHNILRMLAERSCKLTIVPAKTSASDVLAMQPDGIFLSNGPGDPDPCDYAVSAIKTFLNTEIPIFGICLGHQLLGLALGAKTMKMPFGHHGANHPVQDLESKKVMITSQNHGFAIDESTLPVNVKVTHRSLFDNTIQGILVINRAAFSFQGHPEASPGPNDVAHLFDQFIEQMKMTKNNSDA